MSKGRRTAAILISPLLLWLPVQALDQVTGDMATQFNPVLTIRNFTLGSAGAAGTNSTTRSIGTLAQLTPVGTTASSALIHRSGFWAIAPGMIVTDVPEVDSLEDCLVQNYPNPFNPSTTIGFSVAQESHVALEIFNVRGERIRSLVQETKTPGTYRVVWNGRNDRGRKVPSGIYFCRLQTGDFRDVKKMLMVK